MTTEPIATFQIPTLDGGLNIALHSRKPTFIVGRNGTGKSALMNRLSGYYGERIIYMPGSRPSYFDNESLSMGPATRRQFTSNMISWNSSPDTRWRSLSGTMRNEKAILDLYTAETQFKLEAANQIQREGPSSLAISRLQSQDSPLDRVNALLNQGNLSVQMKIIEGELQAEQGGNIYTYARLSDGERSALIFAAEVVSARSNSIFLIDEPELHLHAAIAVPLLKALITERPDCAFVISTHELEIPASTDESTLLIVRGSVWAGTNVVSWNIDVVENPAQIREDVRVDLIGSRKKILFIEGAQSSLDQPLYSILFPKVSVLSRISCREVIQAVDGLRSVTELHRAEAFGLIDNDGMSDEQRFAFQMRGIFPLPIFAVESLYYSNVALDALARQQAELLGLPLDELLNQAKVAAKSTLRPETIMHLASRVAERNLRDKVVSALPSRETLIKGGSVNIEFTSPYEQEHSLLSRWVDNGQLDEIIGRYPVRESGLLDALAKALRFSGRQDYERAFLSMVRRNEKVKNLIREKLGPLASFLH